MVTSFKYLGRLISAADDDWPLVAKKFPRARKVWIRMSCILSREGAAPRASGLFFKAVVQAILIFVLETWVFTPRMGKALGGSQTQVVRRMTGRIPRRKTDNKWRYTSATTAREEAGLLTMEEYGRRCQNMFVQYITMRSLLYLYEGSERAQGARVGMWCWEQVAIDLTGA